MSTEQMKELVFPRILTDFLDLLGNIGVVRAEGLLLKLFVAKHFLLVMPMTILTIIDKIVRRDLKNI